MSKTTSNIEVVAPLYSFFTIVLSCLDQGHRMIIKTDYGEPRSLKLDFTLRLYFM